ncbi:MAG TPA: ComEC/Rec2 family competence protein [Patescibacteria group bacterium]
MKYVIYFLLILLLLVHFFTTRPAYHEGDKVRITSQVTSLTKLADLRIKFPAFPEVHYGDFVVVEGLVANGELKDVVLKDLKVSNNIFLTLRSRILDFYNKSLPPLDSQLTAGIVIGAKSNLDSSFYSKLKNTGTSHVVVASGMNVTLTAGFIMAITLKFIKRRRAILITLLAILIYCYIAGFEAPIVRAAIMSFLAFTAQIVGRVANTLRILFLTAFVMIFIVPSWLTDIGFILSFSTTLSMILFEKKINRLIHSVPNIIRESLSTSISAQIMAAPIIFFTFGRFNPFSPIINAFVLWTVTPIMVIGGIASIVGIIFQPLGKAILLLIYPLTQWFIFVINLFG